MRPKPGIVAQALGVAVLAVIVYLAFLSPNDSGPLTGIGVDPPIEGEPPEHHASKGEHKKPPPDRPGPTVVPSREQAPPLVAPSVLQPPDTPVGSQYAGTAARILAEVARTQ